MNTVRILIRSILDDGESFTLGNIDLECIDYRVSVSFGAVMVDIFTGLSREITEKNKEEIERFTSIWKSIDISHEGIFGNTISIATSMKYEVVIFLTVSED